jgi:hypothetical protein
MKKFLKWSTAFLVLGVLAVGCIKPEPSPGIEAMRNAKAALLNAQATLTQAKVQVEAANAALIMAQASLLTAQEAIVAAQAAKIQAEADFIQAQVEWQNAKTDADKERWAIKIAELEIELELARAQADKRIAAWELQIAEMQDDLVQAMIDYENKLEEFELWKIEHADVLAEALIDALDEVTDDIKAVIRKIARKQVQLNVAKAQYQWYVNVEYPESVEMILMHMEKTKERLTCEVEYLTGIVEAYAAIYDTYHEDFDAIMAGYQEEINDIRATIAELEKMYFQLEDEIVALQAEYDALLVAFNVPYEVYIPDVFSDGGDDYDIGVWDGDYYLNGAKIDVLNVMYRDILLIEDTRHHFEDQDSGIIKANLAAKKKVADDAAKKYQDTWDAWQSDYKKLLIPSGALYAKWYDEWEKYDAAAEDYETHLETYTEMYEEAGSLIQLYMYYLDGVIDVEDGLITLPGGQNISEVLGGIYFDAGNLADFIFGSNGQAVIDLINVITVMLDIPGQLDAIVTQLKAIMDGTHDEGWPAFWDHATSFELKTLPAWNDVMRSVYANSNREITDMSKDEWSVWMFLYWLFESRQVNIGLEEAGTVITINPGPYTDAAAVVLTDFFGLSVANYTTKMNGPDNTNLIKAITAYYKALDGLTTKEDLMFEPFGRQWYVTIKDGATTYPGYEKSAAEAAFATKPLITLKHNPDTYNPPTTQAGVSWSYDPDTWAVLRTYDPSNYHQTEQPENKTEFFFVLEGADGEGRTELYPNLELAGDPTYLGWNCDLWVDYSALIRAGDNCDDETSEWTGDLPLWLWADKGEYATDGHYFRAIWKTRDYQAYQNTWNRVDNGEYAALYDKLIELYTPMVQEYNALVAELNTIQGNIDDKEYLQNTWLPAEIASLEGEIGDYQELIELAWDAHNQGNMADEGLLLAWRLAEANLLEAQQELRRIEENMALYEAGYGVIDWWGDFIRDETAIYQARIDAIVEEIANLQQQLVILEGIRAGLVEDYL